MADRERHLALRWESSIRRARCASVLLRARGARVLVGRVQLPQGSVHTNRLIPFIVLRCPFPCIELFGAYVGRDGSRQGGRAHACNSQHCVRCPSVVGCTLAMHACKFFSHSGFYAAQLLHWRIFDRDALPFGRARRTAPRGRRGGRASTEMDGAPHHHLDMQSTMPIAAECARVAWHYNV